MNKQTIQLIVGIIIALAIIATIIILLVKSKENFDSKIPTNPKIPLLPKPKIYIPDSKCKDYYSVTIKALNDACSRKTIDLQNRIRQKDDQLRQKDETIVELKRKLPAILTDFTAKITEDNTLKIVVNGENFISNDNFVYFGNGTGIYVQGFGLLNSRIPDEFIKSYTDTQIVIVTTELTQPIQNICLKLVKRDQSNEFDESGIICKPVEQLQQNNTFSVTNVVPRFFNHNDIKNLFLEINGNNLTTNNIPALVYLTEGYLVCHDPLYPDGPPRRIDPSENPRDLSRFYFDSNPQKITLAFNNLVGNSPDIAIRVVKDGQTFDFDNIRINPPSFPTDN
jgi:hypothetical protein